MNTERSAQFYFANLGADIVRCASAAQKGDENRYQDSYARAEKTLALLADTGEVSAHAEGVLALRGLEAARETGALDAYTRQINDTVAHIVSTQ